MIIVSDASPISGFIQIGKLSLLNQLYENVIIPTAVNRELSSLKQINVDLSTFENAKRPKNKHNHMKYCSAHDLFVKLLFVPWRR